MPPFWTVTLLAGCPLPEKAEAPPDEAETPSLAWCVENREYHSVDGTSSNVMTITRDALSRMVAYEDVIEDEDGTSAFWAEDTYDDDGCLVESDYGWTWDSIDYGVYESEAYNDAICDTHQNWVEVARLDTWVSGDAEPESDETTETYTNTYDGDDLVEEVMESSDGGSHRIRYTWSDGHLAAYSYYSPAAMLVLTATYEHDDRGNTTRQDVVREGVDQTTWSTWSYDDLDRVSVQVYFDSEYANPEETTTYAYADDEWLWPSSAEVTADGTLLETITYTYDCP
ncbi:MAG: hypothetical protein ACOZNI_16655 [Myxococcota bacterium]